MNPKRLLLLVVLGVAIYGVFEKNPDLIKTATKQSVESDELLATAYRDQQSDIQVNGQGIVVNILPDDSTGSRHQRFIIRLSSGQTVLISHNIDLAPRIGSLREGDTVEFFGEYEWNSKGGVVHWTHHDPAGRHVGGWVKHNGIVYQ